MNSRKVAQQVGPEGLALVLVEAGRDELVDLVGDDRERQEHGAEQGELQLGEEELVRRGVDHLDLLARAARHLIGPDQQVVDLRWRTQKQMHEADADAGQRIDQPLAQLDQMLDQRRLGGLDLVMAVGLTGAAWRGGNVGLVLHPASALKRHSSRPGGAALRRRLASRVSPEVRVRRRFAGVRPVQIAGLDGRPAAARSGCRRHRARTDRAAAWSPCRSTCRCSGAPR